MFDGLSSGLLGSAIANLAIGLSQANAIAKIVAFFSIWLVAWLPIAIPVAIAVNWFPSKPLTAEQKLPLLVPLYLIAPLILWGATQVNGDSFRSYGLVLEPRILISLGLGLGLALLGLMLWLIWQTVLGWMVWQQQPKISLRSVWLPTLLLGLWIGGIEELIFRGFLLNQLQNDYSIWLAAIASSLIFALLHLIWDVQETLPQLPGLWLMGIVLAIARWVDGGSLGLAWGLHAGWIWGIACLDTTQLTQPTDKVPQWVTGLAGKPLAGFTGITLLLANALVLGVIGHWSFVLSKIHP